MRQYDLKILLVPCLLVAEPLAPASASGEESAWVREDSSSHQLAYKTLDQRGDHICDFSYAGYMGGGVALPDLEVKARVESPSGGDDTAAIQQAIDAVSALPLVKGQRGAVLLGPGTFQCATTLIIHTNGVVLRGNSPASTTLSLTGDPHLGLRIAGDATAHAIGGESVIIDDYIPSGAQSFEVKDALAFQAGDTISIIRPVTSAWLAFMGMDHLVRNGKPETWLRNKLETERTIRTVSGQTLELDVPLTDSYDATYLGKEAVKVVRISHAGPDGADLRVSQSGMENLAILAPERHIVLGQPAFDGIQLKGVKDGWVRNVSMTGVTNGLSIDGSQRVTVEKLNVDNATIVGAAKPFDIAINGTQILCDRCTGRGDLVWYAATMARIQGPNVVLNSTFEGNGQIDAHERWSTGFLVDGCRVPDGSIGLHNRGEMGTGHGWTMGWGVVWNCVAKILNVQNPPGSANWQIGCRGENEPPRAPLMPEGIIDSPGTPVAPASLYLAQLRQRLGDQAVHSIGY